MFNFLYSFHQFSNLLKTAVGPKHPQLNFFDIFILKSLAGPKHPPLCQPRCSRGEDDAAPADKNPTTGGKGWRKDKDKVDVQKQNQF